MNHIYRSIWNDHAGTCVAVSEHAVSVGQGQSRAVTGVAPRRLCCLLKPLAAALMAGSLTNAHALPTGGVVTSGSASIAGTATNLTINQATPAASLNWTSFNIDRGQSVVFVQPSGSSVALNRVLGADPSAIFGTLSANGRVFLVNPNGILFGSGASVNVGGLVASTLPISDADFQAGNYHFAGTSAASVVNQGSLTATGVAANAATAAGGFVALLGSSVSNTGTISARLGSVTLAAGTSVTLGIDADNLLSVAVDAGALGSLARNGGLIQADGGHVLLSAVSAGQLLGGVVNNTGVVQAQTIDTHTGTIRLLGDMQVGAAQVGGTLDASAPAGGNGGFIETSAARLQVAAGVQVKAGAAHGAAGQWLLDPLDLTIGSSPGNSDVLAADLANALNGGTNVTLTSESVGAVTGLPGAVAARTGGVGDINVNAPVSWGSDAQLTLSAYRNINLNANITADSSGQGAMGIPQLQLNANALQVNGVSAMSGAVNFAPNVAVTMTGTAPGLTISAPVVNMAPGSQIALTGGNASLSVSSALNMAGSTPEITSSAIVLNGDNTTLTLGALPKLTGDAHIDLLGSANAAQAVTIAGDAYAVISSVGTAGSSNTGNTDRNAGLLADADLQGMQAGLAGRYVLAIDIDASGTSSWNPITAGGNTTYAGFTPVGSSTAPGQAFTGVFEGFGHAVTGLTIVTASGPAGLFGVTSGATLRNVSLVDADVKGFDAVGGLVGHAISTTITNASVSSTGNAEIYGSDSGTLASPSAATTAVGGLVGLSENSTISFSSAAIGVNGQGNVGGLVGNLAGGTLDASYVTFNTAGVAAAADSHNVSVAGGLVGANSGVITRSFSYAAVISADTAGGLVGLQTDGSITDAYAGNSVTGSGIISANLVAGGLLGHLVGGTVNTSYANNYEGTPGGAPGQGETYVEGGLIGRNDRPLATSVFNSYFVTGAQGADSNGNLYNAFEDSGGAGGAAVDSLSQYSSQSYAGFNQGTSGAWISYEGASNPLLRPFMTSVTMKVPDQSLVFNGAAQNPDGSGLTYLLNTFGGSYQIAAPSSSISNAPSTFFIQPPGATITHAGTYAIQATGQTGSQLQGYALDVSGALTVTPAPLTISAVTDTRIYSGTNASAGTPTLTSGTLFGSDTLTGLAQTFTDGNVGPTKGITVSAYTVHDGNSGNDYAVSTVGATGAITPAPLTITATANTKTYDGTLLAAALPSVSGLVNGETLSNLSEVYANPNALVGNALNVVHNFTISTGQLGNYNISYVANTSSAAINPAPIDVVSQNLIKAFGAPDPALSAAYQVSGLFGDPLASVLGGVVRNPGVLSGSYLFLAPTVINSNYRLHNFTGNGALRIMPTVLTAGGVVASGPAMPGGSPTAGSSSLAGATQLSGGASGTATNNGGPGAVSVPAGSIPELPYPLQGLPLSAPALVPATPSDRELLVSNLSVDPLVSPDQSRNINDAR